MSTYPGTPSGPPAGGWSPHLDRGAQHGGRSLPGPAVVAILILVAAPYVTGVITLPLRSLTFAVDQINNVFFVWFVSAAPAAALAGIGVAALRRPRFGRVVAGLLGVHILGLLIIMIVQLVIGAELTYLARTLVALLVVGLGLAAAVIGTVGARRANDPAVIGLVLGTVGVLLDSLIGPAGLALPDASGVAVLLGFTVLLAPAAISLIGYGGRRRSRPLLLAGAALISLLVLAHCLQAFLSAATGPIGAILAVVRALWVLAALVAVILLVRRLSRPEGAAHPQLHPQQRPYGAQDPTRPQPPYQQGSGPAPR